MGYRVRKFLYDQDKEQLFSLWCQVLGSPDRKRLNDMYTDNGYGQPSTWLLIHDETNTPVGSASVFPRKIVSAGQPLLIGVNCDMLMLKEHRTLGPALILLKALIRESEQLGYQVLLAFPGEKANIVFQRAGYKNTGSAFRWVKLINSRGKLATFCSCGVVLNALSLSVNSVVKFVTLEIWARILYPKVWRNSIGRQMSLEEMDFTERCSDVNRLEKMNTFMKWRYRLLRPESPSIFALFRSECLTGYVIYTCTDDEVIIYDLFFLNNSGELHVLMAKFIKRIRKQGVDTVSLLYFGSHDFTEKIKLHGFIQREGRDLFVKDFSGHFIDHPEAIADISFFDGDVDL